MYASLTSTSISRESMSTIVAMPVRVKPPPADIGETDLAGLRVLRDHHALERRADLQVVEALLAERELRLGHADLRPGGRKPRRERSDFGLGRVERALCDQLLLDQGAVALERLARVGEPHLDLAQVAPRGLEAAGGDVVLRLRRRRIEPREHLARLDGAPSSNSTSLMRPVTLELTVARRRATT